jgi:hypothetical protein
MSKITTPVLEVPLIRLPIETGASKTSVDPRFILAIIRQE